MRGGVDLGGTKILAGVVDRDGQVEQRREHATPVTSQADLLAGLDAAVSAGGMETERIVGADTQYCLVLARKDSST